MSRSLFLLRLSLGIGATDIAKLKANNIHTVAVRLSMPISHVDVTSANRIMQSLTSCTTRRLLKIKGFSDIKVEKIKEAAKKLSVSYHMSSHIDFTSLTLRSRQAAASSLLLSLDKFARDASGFLPGASSSMRVWMGIQSLSNLLKLHWRLSLEASRQWASTRSTASSVSPVASTLWVSLTVY